MDDYSGILSSLQGDLQPGGIRSIVVVRFSIWLMNVKGIFIASGTGSCAASIIQNVARVLYKSY
jgi:hypothetical protein